MGQQRLTLLVMIALAAILIACVPQAFAHPFFLDSDPKPFSSVRSSPDTVTAFFSEAIEINYSRMTVLAPDGSRVDMNDASYADGDTATLRVSLQPNLPEGVYTVTTRVLSAIDGHVVDNAFTFGIGVAPVRDADGISVGPTQVLSLAESASRFPGMVGQIIAVGAAFGTLWLWRPLQRVPWLANAITARRIEIDRNMIRLVIIGAGLVLASNAAMISIQAIDIDAGIIEAMGTSFGNIWTIRMIESSILMIIVLFVRHKMVKEGTAPSQAEMIAILVMGLAVMVTSGLMSHGGGQVTSVLLDFFHNVGAGIWIGGIVLMGFVVVPKLLTMSDQRARPAAISILIPRFSTIVVTVLGILVITGPILLFLIESDLSLTLTSTYGRILMAKLALAGVMVALGAYSQVVIQKKVVAATVGGQSVQHTGLSTFSRTLKAEAGVGVALLLMVSLMANAAPPAGEFPQFARVDPLGAFAQTTPDRGYVQVLYTPAGRADLAIQPFALGQNLFTLSFFDLDGRPASGVESASITLTHFDRGIGPIVIEPESKSEGVYTADVAFGIGGTWSIVVEGVRPTATNIVTTLDVDVGPAVSDLSFELVQYETPEPSLPLFPVFDRERNSIWVGDSLPQTGRIWQLDMETGNYTAHTLENITLVTISALDADGRIWYVDPTKALLGQYDPETMTDRKFPLPERGIISGLALDHDGNLWMPVVQLNKVFKFTTSLQEFTSIAIPTPGSVPVAASVDRNGNVWVALSGSNKIAMIDTATNEIKEYEPAGRNKLGEPTVVFPDPDSHNLFISEHGRHGISVFNPLFETFKQYPVINEAGLPFGMAKDKFGNIWYAQHEIDRIAVLDPRTGQGTEVRIPTAGSFIQYIVSDDEGDIWIAMQRAGAIGKITVTAQPPAQQPRPEETEEEDLVAIPGMSFADLAGPGIVAGIVLAALFYAKSATDLNRNIRAVSKVPST